MKFTSQLSAAILASVLGLFSINAMAADQPSGHSDQVTNVHSQAHHTPERWNDTMNKFNIGDNH
ncbi:hypothetical protein [Celerinatantimonas sp. YJH-8]|uniref:hypothetical protein n=1 Tax=Celerinatantimonas sp. YJH-8 TaxID=3228714 RepID=UPI0038BE49EC